MKTTKVKIKATDKVSFNNHAIECIGTGRMYLALHDEYQKQLENVQREIGFKYIRGHGLFCDDVGIYQTYEEDELEKIEYNFTYIDRIFDGYLKLGLKPFVELGFMPKALASGTQTVFYWEGNVTPPKCYDKWADLIKATIQHWIDRYGVDEVLSWPIEVWNEPNLEAFWENADMQEYFRLYEVSARAVKSVNGNIRVGGPSICGVDDERWLSEFLKFTSQNDVPIDFVTRHCYGAQQPDYIGHYAYQKLHPTDYIPNELKNSREIIDSFPQYKGMQMHITEYNTSYSPRNPIHDTNLNAAYVAKLLSVMGDYSQSYSYWTFGDVFEEQGIAFTPFSGCFGLLTNGSIPKPTFWIYEFYSRIGNNAVSRGDDYVVTKTADESYHILTWNIVEESDEEKSEPGVLEFSLEVPNGEYCIVKRVVNEIVGNPLKAWIDLGSPPSPNEEELSLLQDIALPLTSTKSVTVTSGELCLDIEHTPNAICHYKIKKVTPKADRGFIAERVKGAR